MIDYEKFKKEMLSDPETKAEYDALTPEYDIIQAMIDAKKGSVFIIPEEDTTETSPAPAGFLYIQK